jgi:hypothetical protein
MKVNMTVYVMARPQLSFWMLSSFASTLEQRVMDLSSQLVAGMRAVSANSANVIACHFSIEASFECSTESAETPNSERFEMAATVLML